jgi:KDO2-lipid IV(A) lauroyltransferase
VRSLGGEAGPRSLRALAWLIARLPYGWLRPLGAALGWLAGSALRIRRRHVEGSLRAAGIARAAGVARAMYASLGAGLFELFWLAGRPRGALGDRFSFEPSCAEALRQAASLGRGVVVATAHTGNWDLSACAAAHWLATESGFDHGGAALHVVTKRLSWRALDRYWQNLRAARGVVLVDAQGAAAAVREALAGGGVVALMVDQAPERQRGVTTFPFLGAPALHDLGPALLAARSRAPFLAIFGHRAPDGRHILSLGLSMMPEELRARGGAEAATRRIAAALERFVRTHPEQWLWLHRRWKGAAGGGARERGGCPN